MEEIKRRFEFYSYYDCTGIENHLKKMAEKGWMLKDFGMRRWKYRRIEPQSLSFEVVYYNEKVFEGETTPGRQKFIEECSVAGWQFVANSGKVHVFVNKSENPVPIVANAADRVNSIHKFAKNEMIWVNLFLLAVCLGVSIFFAHRFMHKPIDTLSDVFYESVFYHLCVPFSLYSIIKYLLWHKKAVSAAEDGVFTETKRIFSYPVLFFPLWIMGSAFEFCTFFSPPQILFGVIVLVFAIAVWFVFKALRRRIIRKDFAYNKKKAITAVIAVILVAGLVAGSFGIYTLFPKRSGKVTTLEGKTVEIYFDKNLPLDLEDLTPVEGVVSKYKSSEWLGLINITETTQIAPDSGELSMTCKVYQINFAPVYDACVEEIKGIFASDYVEVDPAPWGADKVYRIRYDDGYGNSFIICWENRIADISFSWDPTDEQIAIASRKILESHM